MSLEFKCSENLGLKNCRSNQLSGTSPMTLPKLEESCDLKTAEEYHHQECYYVGTGLYESGPAHIKKYIFPHLDIHACRQVAAGFNPNGLFLNMFRVTYQDTFFQDLCCLISILITGRCTRWSPVVFRMLRCERRRVPCHILEPYCSWSGCTSHGRLHPLFSKPRRELLPNPVHKIPMFVTFINSPTEAKDFSLLFKKSPQKLPTTSLGSYIGLVAANNFSSSSSLQVGWANVKEL